MTIISWSISRTYR